MECLYEDKHRWASLSTCWLGNEKPGFMYHVPVPSCAVLCPCLASVGMVACWALALSWFHASVIYWKGTGTFTSLLQYCANCH